ncbi:MAG: threonine synthase [Candidatus Bathyarchaeota archaeon]|nr:MAG: threonine synthase [Candidatus Bathyarchaeota archaeon]
MSFVSKMKCARCGNEYSLEEKVCMCPRRDDGRLDIHYDYSALAVRVNKKLLVKRVPSVWKYHEFLPVESQRHIVTLGEGGTPLLRANNLGREIGLRNLYLKDETGNPTGSFKDRSMTVGVSKALEFAAKTVATASSGNAAASLAAYSAKARLKCFAFVLDFASSAKIAQIRLYGADVVKVRAVEEGKDPTVQMLRMAIEKYGWYPCPSYGPFNPYQVEGPKTMSYEIIEQLNWNPPDWVIIPVGSACLLTGVWKGFTDFHKVGFIDSMPRLAAIQPTGCAPLVRAFKEGKRPFEIKPWKRPHTIAGGLADFLPWDRDAALVALRNRGTAEAVSDEEILRAQRLLASTEGIFAEPSGVASLAGLIRLLDEDVVGKDGNVVVLITGSGLKDPEVVTKTFKEVSTIKPSTVELEKLWT